MYAAEWVVFLTGLIIWSIFYFIYAVRQEYDTLNFIDPKVQEDSIESMQRRRFFLLIVHSIIYFILTLQTGMVLEARVFHEAAALFTVIIFAFLLYIAEEIGIVQMNRSLNTALPMGEDEKKNGKVNYQDQYKDGISTAF